MAKNGNSTRHEDVEETEADTGVGTKQISLYLETELIDAAKTEADRLSTSGHRFKYTDILRMAMEHGMPFIKGMKR